MDDEFYIPDDELSAFRYAAIDADATEGRTLVGTLISYGDTSTKNMTGGAERFAPGAFGNVSELDTLLNIQHDRRRLVGRTGGGGLVLTDSPESLQIAATLPETRDGDDALTMVEAGILRGFSMEFLPRRERFDRATRVIEKAILPSVALVDRPAYDDSIIAEIRQAGEGISGQFNYDQDTVISATGRTRKERISPGAFAYAVKAPDREINLILGDNSRPLASKISGSLILEDTPGALKFRVKQLPRTSYVADFLSMLRAKTVTPGVVPFFSPTPRRVAQRLFGGPAVKEEEEAPGTGIFRRVVRSGLLTALSILFRPPRGNPGAVTRLPYRLRRPMAGTPNTADAVRPRSGDIIRGNRVIRRGVDVGPVLRQRWI